MDSQQQPSPKSYAVAVSLSAIFGVMGIHHFYLGRYLEGIIDFSLLIITLYFYINGEILWALLFFAIDGIHTFIITIMLLTGSFKDGHGRYVCYPGQKLKSVN
ncbi:NINE protein [uncultured Neptuniibacter sp.]|uniref:NINE protein n=1 Tax=uncultured Neptuniibacter sp. TaxID=502143 RepID=UPI00262323A8|nr:NINE protein [uncultured Neptuniibacter sp.]